MTASWQIVMQEHIYEADALQIASCKEVECQVFVSADRRLVDTAKKRGLVGLDPANDESKLLSL